MKNTLATLTLSFIALSGPVAMAKIVDAEQISACPKAIDGDAEAIAENIAHYIKAKDLFRAADLAADCSTFGSNIDVGLIGPVLEALSASFTAVPAAAKAELQKQTKLCHLRYAGEQGEHGSAGASAAAHCSLKVYAAFDSLYGPREEIK